MRLASALARHHEKGTMATANEEPDGKKGGEDWAKGQFAGEDWLGSAREAQQREVENDVAWRGDKDNPAHPEAPGDALFAPYEYDQYLEKRAWQERKAERSRAWCAIEALLRSLPPVSESPARDDGDEQC
jgi:hypothetical protein